MKTGIIADIQRFSLHDGPGIRTTVFFKGCPLRCAWCHNPECMEFAPQELFYVEKCIGCNRCAEGCFVGARVLCGQEMSVSQVLSAIMQDRPYYSNQGGVTFSGGEPLAQRDFLIELAQACKTEEIHTAIETSLAVYDETALRQMDLIMADLKIWDSEVHRKYTGQGNERIKENLEKANTLGIPILLRTPVISGINQEIHKIAAFANKLRNVYRYELLPYHPLGQSKREALGLPEVSFRIPTKEEMKELSQYAFLR